MKRVCAISITAAVLILTNCSVPKYDGEALWVKELDDATYGDLTLGINGEIYYAGKNRIVALDQDGNERWSFSTDSLNPGPPSVGSDGTLYFGSGWHNEDDSQFAGVLYALSPDARLKWKKEFPSFVETPLIGVDKTLYLLSGGIVYAIDSLGNTIWGGEGVTGIHAISAAGDVYCNCRASFSSISAGYIAAISPDGSTRWEVGVDHDVYSVAIDADGTLYVESINKLQAISPEGSVVWANSSQGAPVVGADGTIYVTEDQSLLALDKDGKTIWEHEIKDKADFFSLSSSLIGSDGTIYIKAYKSYHEEDSITGSLYAFESNGRVKWVYDIPQATISARMCLSDEGVLYFISSKNQLIALQTESMGLASSSWPRAGHDNQNTGLAGGY